MWGHFILSKFYYSTSKTSNTLNKLSLQSKRAFSPPLKALFALKHYNKLKYFLNYANSQTRAYALPVRFHRTFARQYVIRSANHTSPGISLQIHSKKSQLPWLCLQFCSILSFCRNKCAPHNGLSQAFHERYN